MRHADRSMRLHKVRDERRDAAIALVVDQARRYSQGAADPDDPSSQRSAARLQRLSDLHSDMRALSSQLAMSHRRH